MIETKNIIDFHVEGNVSLNITSDLTLGRFYTIDWDEDKGVVSSLSVTLSVPKEEYNNFIDGCDNLILNLPPYADRTLYSYKDYKNRVVLSDGREEIFTAHKGFWKERCLEFEKEGKVVKRFEMENIKSVYIENNGEWVYVTGEDDF